MTIVLVVVLVLVVGRSNVRERVRRRVRVRFSKEKHVMWHRLICAFLLTVRTAWAAEPVNLIANGGFEEGTAGWEPDPKHELVTTPGVAHSGKACLTGEVTAEKQALSLRRRVPVRPGYRYQFEAWAKATNKTKLVLWVVQPGADAKAKPGVGRQNMGAWEELPNQWKKCTGEVQVRGEGMLELQVVAPSSHAAPPGRIWVDDIAFYETEQAIPTMVSESGVFSDEATMAQADDGSLYLAWDSFRDGADTLQVARYGLSGKEFKKLGQWQALGGKGTYILGVKTVAAGDKVFVLYAAEVDKNWDIYALPCSASGPGKPVRITTSDAVDVKPSGAWRDGTLWLAWESSVGGWRQIYAASLRDGVVSKPEQVSVGEASNYDPSVTALAGEVFVAWHSFRQNNFDIYSRRRAGGKWDAERRLTQAPSIDRHPLLTARGADVWLVYENAL
ncbi:MAG: hypothetical protein FJ278_19115, partial [Planctomycetes bacterium]|nr:hypothetical protein [Planctomycetota bacterium]